MAGTTPLPQKTSTVAHESVKEQLLMKRRTAETRLHHPAAGCRRCTATEEWADAGGAHVDGADLADSHRRVADYAANP